MRGPSDCRCAATGSSPEASPAGRTPPSPATPPSSSSSQRDSCHRGRSRGPPAPRRRRCAGNALELGVRRAQIAAAPTWPPLLLVAEVVEDLAAAAALRLRAVALDRAV